MADQVSSIVFFLFVFSTFFFSFFINRDIDSDGDEIPPLEADDPTDFQYSLWFTVDVHVQAPNPQASVNLTAPCLVS